MFKANLVHAVSVGSLREIAFGGKMVATAIFKAPVDGPIHASALGLQGDVQADRTVHGGVDKAVYVYPHEHYQAWKSLLKVSELPPGSFGENLTTEGLIEEELHIGDVLRVGSAIIQVTQPRSPCFKLQLKFGRLDMVALFLRENKPGWYGAVLQEGAVRAGDGIEIISRDPERISITEIWNSGFHRKADAALRRRILDLKILPTYWKERIAR